MTIRLNIDHERLARICDRWQVKELAVFGSALRADFGPDSDVDVLVSFQEGATPSLFDLASLGEELELLLGRRVDLVTRPGVEHSRNPYRRQEILSTAEILYAA